MKFTTSAFIKKNTPELRNKLEKLGYKVIGNIGITIITDSSVGHAYVGDYAILRNSKRINCGTNETLFLALAALREDSDYMQWFYSPELNHWKLCEVDSLFASDFEYSACYYKVPAGELIEHFKEEEV